MEITIFIQGHGEEDYEKYNPNFPLGNLELLSYSSIPGQVGFMVGPRICGDKSLDEAAVNFLKEFYFEKRVQNQRSLITSCISHLRKFYKNFGIEYPGGGFAFTQPLRERFYYLEANPHENCSKCIFEEYDDGTLTKRYKRCLKTRDESKLLCPLYGITVMKSSNPEDMKFTLEGESTHVANMNITMSTMEYWANKCVTQYDRDNMIKKISSKKMISLTEIYYYFTKMGFTKIYIHDPTCRSIVREGEYKKLTGADFKRLARHIIDERKKEPLHSSTILSQVVDRVVDQERRRLRLEEIDRATLINGRTLNICIASACFALLLNSGLLDKLMKILGISGGKKCNTKKRNTKHGGTKHGGTKHGATKKRNTKHGGTKKRNTKHGATKKRNTKHGGTKRKFGEIEGPERETPEGPERETPEGLERETSEELETTPQGTVTDIDFDKENNIIMFEVNDQIIEVDKESLKEKLIENLDLQLPK